MDDALVSVIMPIYNGAETADRSIESVLKQAGGLVGELVIVDDCSTDNSLAIAHEWASQDVRVRVVPLPRNTGGPAIPRNVGIELATHRFVAFLDVDDWWEANKTVTQLDFLLTHGLDLACTAVRMVDHHGGFLYHFSPPAQVTLSKLLQRNTLVLSSVLVDTRAVGKFFFPQCGHEDYALWLHLLARGARVGGLPEPLTNYSISPGSVSSNPLRNVRFLSEATQAGLGFSPWRSNLHALRYAGRASGRFVRNRLGTRPGGSFAGSSRWRV